MRLAWIAAISFASGFPFGLVNEALPVYLRTHGASLVDVGNVQAATFPWTFKFFWAPLVDRLGTRRRWIGACLAGLALLTAALASFETSGLNRVFWLVVLGMVILSATQDIAIDAYTIESTTTRELGVANSVRISAYRVAMFTAGGILIWLAGRIGWQASFIAGAVVLGGLMAGTLLMPSVSRVAAAPVAVWEPLRALFARRGIWAVVVFALLFKLDIAAMEPMTRPFWVDRGLTLTEIGAILTTGRMLATIAGAVVGGIFTTRWGIFRGLWVLGLIQALSSLGYWGAAAVAPSKPVIVAVALFENFAAGLGTAAFVAFLMSVCEKRFAATQYAVLSALLALTRSVAGWLSGGLAERAGYAPYFLLTFALAFPAYLLLPLIRNAPLEDGTPPLAG